MLETKTIDLSTIEGRVPVVSSELAQSLKTTELEGQWRFLTEAIKRELLASHDVRTKLISLSNTPVSEQLPNTAVNLITEENPRVAKLAGRYQEHLGKYLSLPPVPDENIVPDVRHAPPMDDLERRIDFLRRITDGDEVEFNERLQEEIDEGTFLKGITPDERRLVATRYRYARDIKLLTLGAEIVETGGKINLGSENQAILPSGTVVRVNPEASEEVKQDLADPLNWEKRRQLKDRVYEVVCNGRTYILKEKKTARHTDTKRGGHIDGRTSSAEFDIARDFEQHGKVKEGIISVGWEKPLGVVTFPDGYQFALYGYEEGLIDAKDSTENIASAIVRHQDQFKAEYEQIANLANQFSNSEEIIRYSDEDEEIHPLSFEEFAQIKAFRAEQRAKDLLWETINNTGYNNSDLDGYAYRLKETSSEVELEIVGFDFEYFSLIPHEESIKRWQGTKTLIE